MDEADSAEDGAPPTKGSRDHYVVGKGKPPEHGKIKKGEVRNPRGKRRGTRSFKTEAREMLAMPVPVTGANGKVRRISTRAALLLKLREKALKGDSRALDRMMEMAREHDLDDTNTSTRALQKEDEAIMKNMLERQKALLARDVPPSTPELGDDM